MATVTRVLIGLSALSFVVAVVTALSGVSILGAHPEGFSRACSNLALLAIALSVTSVRKPAAG